MLKLAIGASWRGQKHARSTSLIIYDVSRLRKGSGGRTIATWWEKIETKESKHNFFSRSFSVIQKKKKASQRIRAFLGR